MRVLIIGAAGMLGRKLADAIATSGLGGNPVESLALADVVPANAPSGYQGDLAIRHGDITKADTLRDWVAKRPDVVFHLAAIVSSDAEQNFEKGYAVNVDGTRNLLEAIRLEGESGPYKPRVVLTSSLAVFGPPLPPVIDDDFGLMPQTSYGVQKAICELLLADYSRKGYLEGVGLRLPTVCIRPGKPNKAASGFFSNILREPLAGREAVLPVPDSVRHWHVSPRRAVGFLLHAATIDQQALGNRYILNLPGVSATVAEQIDALRNVAGEAAVRLIRREPDPEIARIVLGWPQNFSATRAKALGFVADKSFEEIIRIHLEDDAGPA